MDVVAPRRLLPGSSPPWSAWCDRFIAQHLPLMRKGSRATYRSIITFHIEPTFRERHVHEVTAPLVQEWIAAQARHGGKPHTIRGRYRVLRTMLGAAMTAGLAASLPPRASIRFPRQDRVAVTARERAFSPQERDQLLAAPGPTWQRTLFHLLANTGVRIGEALALSWKHVDLGRRQIAIRQSASGGEIHATKTQTSVRDIPISDSLASMLRQYQRESGAQIGLLFPNPHGRPRSSEGIRHYFRRLCHQLGIPVRGPHAFRHRIAGDLLTAGASPAAVRDLLGHSDLRTTSQYAQARDQERRDAVNALEKLLNHSDRQNAHTEQ